MTFDDYLDTGRIFLAWPRSRETEKTQILDALRLAYEKSPIAKKMFDDWFADEQHQITITRKPGKYQGVTTKNDDGTLNPTGQLEIDLEFEKDLTWITSNGKVVQQTNLTSILHELGHALKGLNDNDNAGPGAGANQEFINTISDELKVADRVSYQAIDGTGQTLKKGTDFTGGEKIDGARFSDNITPDDVKLGEDDSSKSVLGVGTNNDSKITMGDGNDFLAGQGGNDALDGGKGTDTAVYAGKKSDYDLSKAADGTWTIKHARGLKKDETGDGTDTLKNIEKVKFSDTTIELNVKPISIEEVYIALFGRPADPSGLGFFNGVTGYGTNLSAIGDLTSTAEYQSRFTGFSATQVIQDIYRSLFSRDGEQAGVSFFVSEFEAGRQTINSIAINILQGALGTDLQVIINKLNAAAKFLAALDTQAEIDAYKGDAAAEIGRIFLTNITGDPASIPSDAAAQNAIDTLFALGSGTDISTGGVNITLTSPTDSVSPTAADSALKSTSSDDTITAPAGTLASTTTIDAGGGNDSLTATIVEPGIISPTLIGLEKVYVTMAGSGVGGEINLSKANGLSEVWNTASSRDFFASEITKGTKLGVEGSVQTSAFTYKTAEVAGGSDSADISLKNVQSTKSLILVDVETVNLAVMGSSSVASIIFPDAATVRVSGSGDLKASFSGANSTFDAASLNGKLDIAFTNTTKGVTFTGTSSADKVQFETGSSVLVDTIVFTPANASTLAKRDVYSGFVAGGTEDKINLSELVLEGNKASIKTFGVAPTDGVSFGGYAIGRSGSNTIYVDTNNDGILNTATDLAFDITGSAAALTSADFIF